MKNYTRKTDQEVHEIALGIFQHEIFTDRHISPDSSQNMITSVFMVLIFMSEEALKDLKDVGMIYESMSKAGHFAVNGYPTFFSARLADVEDAERIWKEYERIKKALAQIEPEAAGKEER